MPHSFSTPNPPSSEQHGTFQTLSPPPPPLAPVTRPQSPRALSCDAQLRPLCLSLPAPEQKPGLCSPMPIPKRGCGASLPSIQYILLLLTLNTLSQVPETLPKRVSHSFYSLGAPAPAHCPGVSELGPPRPTILLPFQANGVIFRLSPKSSCGEGAQLPMSSLNQMGGRCQKHCLVISH